MHFSGPVYLLLAIASSAAMTLFLKGFKTDGTNRYAIILGNYITCVVVGFFMLKEPALLWRPERMTALSGMLGGFLFVVSLVLIQKSIETNGAILSSAFSRMGLVIPLIISIAFFNEKPKVVQILGMLLVFAAIWVINGRREQESAASPMLLIAVLAAGGFSDSMAKIFERFGSPAQADLYIFLVFFTAAVITLLLLIREYRRIGKLGRVRDFAGGIAVGIPNYFSASLLLKSLSTVPAYIAYTVFATGVLLLITLISLIFFEEKLSRRQLLGTGMILLSLVLLNI